MQYFPLSFTWISDTVARLPNWHNKQDICLAKSVYLARQYCRCRNKNTCFQQQISVAYFMSLNFLQARIIFLLIAKLH